MKFLSFVFSVLIFPQTLLALEIEDLAGCESDRDCVIVDTHCYRVKAISNSNIQKHKDYMSHTKMRCELGIKPQWKEYYRAVCENKSCKAVDINSVRKDKVPAEIIKVCFDNGGRVADRHEDYNFSDVWDRRPNAQLLLACRDSDNSWYLFCERGGYAPRKTQYSFEQDQSGKWNMKTIKGEPREYCKE
ncbi:hypothetical protein DOM22_10885 [Bdellovibrio sp. ZAP7]|uniref:hypothetical protein n=1 Tax=Bdellovibrio sp. ZAP7 TaxID=2231053 RepID=UPI00115B1A45|nr:hypothetical protein [Bdellovibrio sp. ZAP7]QDK45616.1 hypothetical protein DOM22_10885 [Bdellovibrio sp. ZAP7]